MWLNKTNQVEQVEAALLANLLSEGGIPLEGDGQSDENIVQTAWTANEGRPFYVVRDWLLLDIMVPSEVEKGLESNGLQPTVVFASTVVYDSRAEGSRAGAIRSSFQRVLDGYVFESMNTTFFLAGPGMRKFVSLPALLALENS